MFVSFHRRHFPDRLAMAAASATCSSSMKAVGFVSRLSNQLNQSAVCGLIVLKALISFSAEAIFFFDKFWVREFGFLGLNTE